MLQFSRAIHLCTRLRNNNIQPLILTQNAITRLKQIAKPNEHLRIIVEGGGCSGFEYKLSLDDKLTDEDLSVEKDGAKVVVDKVGFYARNLLL